MMFLKSLLSTEDQDGYISVFFKEGFRGDGNKDGDAIKQPTQEQKHVDDCGSHDVIQRP